MAKLVGGHLTISKGSSSLQAQMDDIDTSTCAFFIRNPRRFNSAPLKAADIQKFAQTMKDPSILLPHAPHVINLANEENREKHVQCLEEDLEKCNQLGIQYYNIHPGSDVSKLGVVAATRLISDNINKLKNQNVTIVLENIAGDGRKVGSTFEELRDIIENVFLKDRVGICLDTCHLFGAGYDIRTEEKFKKVMEDFDNIVGLKYLKGMHLNDSKCGLNTKKDRHEQLGKGLIGLDAFKFVIGNEIFDNIPLILETPDVSLYKKEIELLRSFVKVE